MRITYEFAKNDSQVNPIAPVVVLLDGKVVGKIRTVPGGFQYITKNAHTGDVFASFRMCQKSLEDL